MNLEQWQISCSHLWEPGGGVEYMEIEKPIFEFENKKMIMKAIEKDYVIVHWLIDYDN